MKTLINEIKANLPRIKNANVMACSQPQLAGILRNYTSFFDEAAEKAYNLKMYKLAYELAEAYFLTEEMAKRHSFRLFTSLRERNEIRMHLKHYIRLATF